MSEPLFCPYCGSELKLIKQWKLQSPKSKIGFLNKKYECPSCKITFTVSQRVTDES